MINKEKINNIDFHIYKTNRYKKSKVEITLRREIEKDKLSLYAFLVNMMNETSLKYPTRRLKAIRSEELYNTRIGMGLTKKGMLYKIYFEVNFINMEYINEDSYLKEVLEYFYEIVLNPNFKDEKVFDMVKTNLKLDIESSKEFQGSLSYENTLKLMDEDSITALNEIGTINDVDKVTVKDLENAYKDIFTTSKLDVFIMGNTDVNKIKGEFNKIFKLTSNNIELPLYVENKFKDTPEYQEEDSSFDQTSLNIVYNLKEMTDREYHIVFPMFNFIFGNGGLSSKLYKYVREENSLCYGIGSSHMKYDKLLMINCNLKYDNINKAIECINRALDEMKTGVFTEEDIKESLNNLLTSLKLQMKDPTSVYYHYQFELFYGAYPFETFLKELPTVTKKEIMDVASKLVLNTTYILREAKDGNN